MAEGVLLIEIKDELNKGLSNNHCCLKHVINEKALAWLVDGEYLKGSKFKDLIVKEE